MNLSIIVPVFNERTTLGPVLLAIAAALPAVSKEIVVVDDGSTDGTRDWLAEAVPGGRREGGVLGLDGDGRLVVAVDETGAPPLVIRALMHERNHGKGRALRTGFAAATGAVIVIQDADLEYDPQEWARMYPLIAERKVADVVFGSRFFGSPHRSLYYHHYIANRLISRLFNVLYNQTLMDIEVCYKMMSRAVLDSLALSLDGFGIEIEMSAKIALSRRWRIYEVGISYFGRTYAEGKKINWRDGVQALWYLFRFRIGG
jgi:glycosyltransferase involved in cell wall biosynthesis